MRTKSTVSILLLSILATTAAHAQDAPGAKTDSIPTIVPGSKTDSIPTITLEDLDDYLDDDGSASVQGASNVYIPTQNPFLFTSISTFGRFFYRPRAFNNYELQVNGIMINNYQRGFSSFAQMGGLTDVTHSQNQVYGLNPSAYGYGGQIGTRHIDATAADQRKGNTLTYTFNGNSYKNRVMYTYNSGLKKNGWAYSLSASRRWANERYQTGTFYDGYSLYGAVSKVIRRSQFNLTAFAAPTVRGMAVYAIDESYNLANSNQYNPAWGYQNGEKRNSRISDVFQPIAIANYTYKPSERTRWTTSAGYEFGKNRRSSIDFYNSYNPAPDYYRNLPSYYLYNNTPNDTMAAAVSTQLHNNPQLLQIDWANLYSQNYANIETMKSVNGVAGNDITGRRSLYVMSDQVDDMKKFTFNTNIEHNVNEHITLDGGLKFVSQNDQYYKQLTDLMGGDYFVNYNQFASQQNPGNYAYAQNNLNQPNQAIKTGDIYGYNAKINLMDASAWGQSVFSYDKLAFFVAASAGYNSFYRDGLMRNGLFANNSFGKSDTHDFLTYRIKGGVSYKIDGHNFIYVNADHSELPPTPFNTYVSYETRDYTIANPTSIKSNTVEGGYVFKSTRFNAKLSGYSTSRSDVSSIRRFYNDDPSIMSFVNYAMTGVSDRSVGAEFVGSYKISSYWTVTGFAAEGESYYTNSPMATVFQDNVPGAVSVAHKVYVNNYYISTGPQSVYSLGLSYKPAGNWYIQGNVNYMDRNYVSINPDRRTPAATDLVAPNSDQWNKILDQEKLPSAYTVDLRGGKTFNMNRYIKDLRHKTQLAVTLGIYNLLNDTNIKIRGFEQLRYDYTNRNPDRFPNKYGYAAGINFYANVSLRF